MDERAIRQAYRLILQQPFTGKGLMPYAQEYARLGLKNGFRGQDLKDNALRVVTNLIHWRGEVAKRTKALLREFIRS